MRRSPTAELVDRSPSIGRAQRVRDRLPANQPLFEDFFFGDLDELLDLDERRLAGDGSDSCGFGIPDSSFAVDGSGLNRYRRSCGNAVCEAPRRRIRP